MSTEKGSRPPRRTVRHLSSAKQRGEKIVALTAYDFLMSRILDEEAVDLILVGDSLAQVVLGYDSTLPVTLDEMIHHARAVRRGAQSTFVTVDLPFMSFQVSPERALENAGRVMKEARAEAVKVEGGDESACEVVRRIVGAGIPVLGHIGLTPQAVNRLGGYRVQGRGVEAARRLQEEAQALQEAGCFGIVLELVPTDLAGRITEALEIPTIGIGAGERTDGQVLVLYDMLGLNAGFSPRFLKRFANLDASVREGVRAYIEQVRAGTYPGPEHGFDE